MSSPFSPPSFYVNYQPPAPRSDFNMPVPGWGWPASSAGPRNVGVGGYSGLGETYDYNAPVVGTGKFEFPSSQMGQDAANGAMDALRAQLPEVMRSIQAQLPGVMDAIRAELPAIIQSAQADVTMTIVKGAVVAAAIGAAAILGYKYLAGGK